MEVDGIGIYGANAGMTISAVRNDEMFTIRINDGEDRQIGVIRNVCNIPRGLDMAQGYVQGYLAGHRAGEDDLFADICRALSIDPADYAVRRPPLGEVNFGEQAIHELNK